MAVEEVVSAHLYEYEPARSQEKKIRQFWLREDRPLPGAAPLKAQEARE